MRQIGTSVGIIEIYKSAFQMQPMLVIADIAAFLFLLLTCVIVLWIVLPVKHRLILKEFEELSNQ